MTRRKLKSRSGSSILFAILVFLVCALAGAAAVTAAASNMGRYAHLRADQQKYLTLSSAARLVLETVGGDGVELAGCATLTTTETVTYTPPGYDEHGNATEASSSSETSNAFSWEGVVAPDVFYTGALAGWFGDDMGKMLSGDVPASMNVDGMSGTFPSGDTVLADFPTYNNLTVKGKDDLADRLGSDVTWSFAMAENYDITAVFQLPGAEYKTELVLPARVETVPGTEVTTTSVWNEDGNLVTTTTTVTTWRRTVTWPLDGARFTQVKWEESASPTPTH